MLVGINELMQCAYPENIHTLPQKGLEFLGGWGGSVRPQNLKKCVKLYWYFQRGGGVLEKKSLLWGRCGYFLELHNPILVKLHACAKMVSACMDV